MSKKKSRQQPRKQGNDHAQNEAGLTLKDLLNADMLDKLKQQSAALKQSEESRKLEEEQKKAEERKKEQKRLESDFSYLLENSDPNWSKYK